MSTVYAGSLLIATVAGDGEFTAPVGRSQTIYTPLRARVSLLDYALGTSLSTDLC